MDAITFSRMKAIDANCAYLGMDPLQLMENAGAGIAREISSRLHSGTVLFIAGRGNNGGDAFVAARHLAIEEGYRIKVLLLGHRSRIRTEESLTNFGLLSNSGISEIKEISDSSELRAYHGWSEADIVVDAVLGSGIKGAPRELESTAIDLINSGGKFVISVDIPSGLDPGASIPGKCVNADLTLTFHKMKKELLLPDVGQFTGEVKVIGIGVCRDAESFAGKGDIMNLRRRSQTSHKGDSGRVLVIGGGPYYGAPVFTSMAALRAGADIVTLAVPESIADTVASFSPDFIISRLPGTFLKPDHVPRIRELLESHDVVVIGPGLGRERMTREAIARILAICKRAVIDADGLYNLSLPAERNGEFIITPHPAEYARLAGDRLPGDFEKRKDIVCAFSKEKHIVTLLKGSIDIVSDGKEVRLNRTGNAGMTVGGTGDVLAGIVGALFAVNDAIDAATCGCFINGMAGDFAFEQRGRGLLASDILEKITDVMKGL
ncbi:NAD(P)H-hydrate dehydratase [Methanolobus halotolerans]|uniref:Bifunctional NAD(P)H-hydrate repair enzyme n=1 Tax=Methanolobus halotolerans TaxID=2052935 RepID=A0A4E0QZ89_9EURY|nr:NAD(P)H-hydrate dehydratase [Methanolobus halotolerans]TGC09034.1 bifunctional ADP-dependent NAD(P)H-hydrate dehydratase/NAD(P)H-hydrate epimerase [Methanolobus halotolerans]